MESLDLSLPLFYLCSLLHFFYTVATCSALKEKTYEFYASPFFNNH